jgi:outer membrane murein-binding lipoprotein Lpp
MSAPENDPPSALTDRSNASSGVLLDIMTSKSEQHQAALQRGALVAADRGTTADSTRLSSSSDASILRRLDRQEMTSREQGRMMQATMMICYGNLIRSTLCAKACACLKADVRDVAADVRAASLRLQHQSSSLSELSGSVDSLEQSVEARSRTVEAIKMSLRRQCDETAGTFARLRRDMQRQASELETQSRALMRLKRSRLHQDVVADIGCVMGAGVLAGSPVVGLPISVLVSLLRLLPFQTKRRARVMRQGLRWLAFLLAWWRLRALAERYGLRSGIGTIERYLDAAGEWIASEGEERVTITEESTSRAEEPRRKCVL